MVVLAICGTTSLGLEARAADDNLAMKRPGDLGDRPQETPMRETSMRGAGGAVDAACPHEDQRQSRDWSDISVHEKSI